MAKILRMGEGKFSTTDIYTTRVSVNVNDNVYVCLPDHVIRVYTCIAADPKMSSNIYIYTH